MALPEPTGPADNPWNREYSDLEWKTAKELWPQYKSPREKGTGPLIWGSSSNIRTHIDEEVEKTNRRAGKLAILQRAIHRETQNEHDKDNPK